MPKNKADIRSQIFGGVCDKTDTERMGWLRLCDDFQSRMSLASLLISQYRYNDALTVFGDALKIKNNDASLFIKIGGTHLTLLHFDEALNAYNKALNLGVNEKVLAYPLAVLEYLRGDYEKAAVKFQSCLPCDNELKIAVIYFEVLSSFKSGKSSLLSGEWSDDMDVGHHRAYKLAVSVMLKRKPANEAIDEIKEYNDLDFVVAAYGIASHLEFIGESDEAKKLLNLLFERESVWPCISYLCAVTENRARFMTTL